MLTPAQQFAVRAGIEKAKIIRSRDFETVDFKLEDFEHLRPKVKKSNITDDDEDDEDNVA